MALRYGQTREDHPDGTTTVTGRCFVTHKEHSITVPTAGLNAWLAGAYIQDALASVPKDVREFLLSSTSPEGWAQVFGNDEEE